MNTLEYIVNKYSLPDIKSPVTIPNTSRNDLAILFKELNFTTGAEIGVWKGRYSEVLCRANPDLKLYSIDPWDFRNFYETQAEGNTIYENAKNRLSSYKCSIIRAFSMDAVQEIQDYSLDFVYIDGAHDFQNCTNDICEWSKKVKAGGIISGHDYGWWYKRGIHVYQVVNAYTYAYKIKPWFILGDKDKTLSWMWVKI
jgi:hypothetical protein